MLDLWPLRIAHMWPGEEPRAGIFVEMIADEIWADTDCDWTESDWLDSPPMGSPMLLAIDASGSPCTYFAWGLDAFESIQPLAGTERSARIFVALCASEF